MGYLTAGSTIVTSPGVGTPVAFWADFHQAGTYCASAEILGSPPEWAVNLPDAAYGGCRTVNGPSSHYYQLFAKASSPSTAAAKLVFRIEADDGFREQRFFLTAN